MIELTRQYGRYGYRRVAALLRDAGWQVNDKRVERLWQREGLKVPMKQPKKGRMAFHEMLGNSGHTEHLTESFNAFEYLCIEVDLDLLCSALVQDKMPSWGG
jgi:transposase InsO family protein